MSRARRHRQQQHTAGIDTDALEQLAVYLGIIDVDGQRVPALRPLCEVDDHMPFDAQICAAGVKAFVRPLLASDVPDPARMFKGAPAMAAECAADLARFEYVLVREAAPGIRTRLGIAIRHLHPERN